MGTTKISLKVGDNIQLKTGAKYTSGKIIPDWVINTAPLYVREIRNNQDIIFSTLPTGAITGVINIDQIKSVDTSDTKNSVKLTGNSNEEKIWNYLYEQLGNAYGVAGIMGNIYAESALNPKNLQNTFEKKLGMTDEQYTKAVDNNTYTNFVHDSAGYGLVQWTFWSLKQELLNYVRSKGTSIGDLGTQLEFLCKQLSESYSSAVWKVCKNAKSIREASDAMLLKFERPANQGATVQAQRASYGQKYYDKYAKKTTKTDSIKETKIVTSEVQTMKYSSSNKPLQCMMTQSTCYRGTNKMEVKGILWHSTGANNPWIKRYVQPDDNASNKTELLNKIGKNTEKSDWNHVRYEAGLNAWIGKLADGTVTTVQTMPWNYRPWGCGQGSRGSCNDGWIQFEICEDGLNNKEYFEKVYEEAAQLTAFLCQLYDIDPNGTVTKGGVKVPTILCHADSHALGLGSNHADVNHWFPKFGKSMSTARARVSEILKGKGQNTKTQKSKENSKTTTSSTNTTTTQTTGIDVGDLVSLKADAVYWDGRKIPDWVKKEKWFVYSVGKDGRIVINQNENRTNTIMSPVNAKYLTVVSSTASKEFQVRITVDALNYRAAANTNSKINGVIRDRGVYTIVAKSQDNKGSWWGKLKSGAGWINLAYTKQI